MYKLSLIFLLIISFGSKQSFAYTPKEGNVAAALGPYFLQNTFSGSVNDSKSPIKGGFGLSVLGDLDNNGSLELGVFHFEKIFVIDKTEGSIMQRSQVVHIPMGYRHWFTEKFSMSLSFFSDYPMGGVKTVTTAGSSLLDQTSANDKVDYGFDISARLEVFERSEYSVVTDLRYSYLLTKNEKESSDVIGFFLGLQFPVQ